MINNWLSIFYLSLGLSSCAFAYSDRTEGLISYEGKSVKAMFINKSLDTKLDLTVLDFVVEHSTINDVIESLGKVKQIKTGQSAYSNVSVCYIGKNHSGVKFNAGEMGQGRIINSIEIFNQDYLKVENCSATSDERIIENLGTGRGIRLGISKASSLKILGTPSYKHNKNDWDYLYQSKVKSEKCEGGFDVIESYKLKFRNDKLIHFFVTKTTSC